MEFLWLEEFSSKQLKVFLKNMTSQIYCELFGSNEVEGEGGKDKGDLQDSWRGTLDEGLE